jgi:hemerythrin-like metal-binding protein
MAFIEWDESYSVNNAEFDAQHRKWLEILNDLQAGLENGGGDVDAETVAALAALMDYVRQHFLAEEKYMREIGYPDTIAHIRIHNECYGRVSSYLLTVESGGRVSVAELLRFLGDWLLEHILKEDKKYSLYAARTDGQLL